MLHVYKDVFPPIVGGVEKQIDLLRRAMPDVVSNVVVCSRSMRTSRQTVHGGLEVRVAELGPRLLSTPIAPTMPRWVGRVDADLIHLHVPNPPGELAVLLARKGRPVVVTYHAEIVRQARFERAYRPLADACLDRAAAIIAGSDRLAEVSVPLRRRADKVRVIRYAVDVERFRPDAVPEAQRAELRNRYGGGPLVVAVGRLVYYKGYEYLIEAARDLDASIVVVGGGPAAGRLRRRARAVPNVHLVGEVDEDGLIAHLAAADCFALSSTSRAESFGIAVAEAQAMGLPAVVTDTGTGTPETVDAGVTGIVVPPRDASALADALRAVLTDPARRQAMATAARDRAVHRYAMRERADETRALYEEVIS